MLSLCTAAATGLLANNLPTQLAPANSSASSSAADAPASQAGFVDDHRNWTMRSNTTVLVSFSTRVTEFQPAWDVTQGYAARWNYSTTLRTERRLPTTMHAGWEKIGLIAESLNAGFETVLYVDDDAFVNKHELGLNYWLGRLGESRDMLIGVKQAGVASADADDHGTTGAHSLKGVRATDHVAAAPPVGTAFEANTGVFVVRRSAWSLDFFNNFVNRCTETERESTECCWEQDCFNRLMNEKPEWRSKLMLTSLDELNCQPSHKSYVEVCDPFVIHAMGVAEKTNLSPMASMHQAYGRALAPSESYAVSGITLDAPLSEQRAHLARSY